MTEEIKEEGMSPLKKKIVGGALATAVAAGGIAMSIDFSDKSTVGGNKQTAEVINQNTDDHSIKTNDINSGGDVNIGSPSGQK